MEEEKKESQTWRSSASDLENLGQTHMEEKLEEELKSKLILQESNVGLFNLGLCYCL